MITATIGKIFLEAYNEKFGKHYDAKSFFVEVYYPLFFDSNKYLQWVQNSPFVQMEKGQKVETLSQAERKEKLQKFIQKVEDCNKPDASIAPGFPASEEKEFATTSGQVTNLDFSTTKDDIYLSWLGSSLSIGIKGGYLLLSESSILLDLFEGWEWYRRTLDTTERLKGNQINTWNGQWIAHRYDKRNFYPEQPMAGFAFDSLFETTKEGISITTLSWTTILIRIAKQFRNIKLLGYFYGFDTKRKLPITLGFIPINLEGIRRPIDLFQKYFGMKDNEDNKAEDLWGTEYGLKGSCKLGVIGIKAMQPEGLSQYIIGDNGKDVKQPKYDEKQIINFHTYQIWLLAMLNNEELWTKSKEFAQTLQTYVNKDKKLSTKRGNLVKNILTATSKKTFLLALSEIASDIESFNKIEDNAKVIHTMPTDNVPYYLTLIRFHYAGLSNKNNQQALQLELN
jgi:hypothetical protein